MDSDYKDDKFKDFIEDVEAFARQYGYEIINIQVK